MLKCAIKQNETRLEINNQPIASHLMYEQKISTVVP